MDTAKLTSPLGAGIGFAVLAIAFVATANWLLGIAFALLAISLIVNSIRNQSEPQK